LGNIFYNNENFKDFITNLLYNKEEFSDEFKKYNKFSDTNLLEISSLIRGLITTRDAGSEINEKLKKLGKLTEIAKDIKNLSKSIGILNKEESRITDKEINQY
jgi:hypothetical protein